MRRASPLLLEANLISSPDATRSNDAVRCNRAMKMRTKGDDAAAAAADDDDDDDDDDS